jgi:hypothetical protein
MDPLDRQLMDAGAAWRESQRADPDLDRLVAGLGGRRARAFSPRLTFVFAVGLLAIAGLGVATGGGGLFRTFRNGLPVGPTSSAIVNATNSPTPSSPSTPSASPQTTPLQTDAERATSLLDTYESSLVAGKWQDAFALLAPGSPTHAMGLDAYAAERTPYYRTVAGRYQLGEPTRDVADWGTYAPLIDGADVSRVYLIEADYPALSGNNAGYEQFVVGPDSAGDWWIWPVR